MGYQIRNCIDSDQVIITDTDLSAYANRIIVLEEYPNICWEVLGEEEPPPTGGPEVTITDCFFNCEECNRIAYQLTDCTGRLQPIFSKQEDLADLVGSIIKVPYYNNSCFTVSVVDYDQQQTYYLIEYSNTYDTCSACRQLKTVYPESTVTLCDPAEVKKIKCAFSEAIYQEVMSKRFGVKHCCETDKVKWTLKNELLSLQLIDFVSPALPEPIVDDCCINTEPICNTPSNCTSCTPVVEEAECPCYCLASEGSPHDCHTYTFTITTEMLNDATGNTDTNTNNRVYFGYFACGATTVTTERYSVGDEGDKEICVLGVPILGWYKDNIWTEYTTIVGATLTRGAVCEEVINECNTCN